MRHLPLTAIAILCFTSPHLWAQPNPKPIRVDQIKIGPKITPPPLSDADKAKEGPKITPPPLKKGDTAKKIDTLLSIDSLTATRLLDKVGLEATVSNPNLKTVSSASYSIERWTGVAWLAVKSGSLSLKFKERTSITAHALVSDDAQKFRITVKQSVQGSVETSVRKRIWIASFICPEWQLYRHLEDAFVLDAKVAANKLNTMGFQSKTVKETDFFGDVEFYIYYRAPNRVERIFSTESAARAFLKSLPQQGVASSIASRAE